MKCGHKLLNYKSKNTILGFFIYLWRGTYIHHGTHGHGACVRSKDNLQESFPGVELYTVRLGSRASSLNQLIAPISYFKMYEFGEQSWTLRIPQWES